MPNSGLVFRKVFTGPAEPEEGLKIDESSQNPFIALEILACVMSGKIVLLFCLIEVHKAGTVFDNQGWTVYSLFFLGLQESRE